MKAESDTRPLLVVACLQSLILNSGTDLVLPIQKYQFKLLDGAQNPPINVITVHAEIIATA